MIPYIDAGPWQLGPFTIHLFGILVGLAIIFGVTMSQRDADKRGIPPAIVSEMQIWAIVVGFLMAHWVSVIFYFPERVLKDPLELLWVWKGISSFGGIIGGALGLVIYLKWIKKLDPWPSIDAIAYGFSWAWVLGRLGCTTAHDHPGRVTDFWFSVSYPAYQSGATPAQMIPYDDVPKLYIPELERAMPWVQRYDLGFYEMLFAVALVTILWATNRHAKRFPGFNVVVLALLYAPVRFGLDFLRISDKTYWGLTPGQYSAIGILALGLWMLHYRLKVARAAALAPGDAPEPQSPTPKPAAQAKPPRKKGKKR
ncbi:MAG: prolipoprotein diacylglyceryl transferase [Polyangia bacterium]|nr:prolipoprotein diacylglyceryl transferase [Polyangia bacterium]